MQTTLYTAFPCPPPTPPGYVPFNWLNILIPTPVFLPCRPIGSNFKVWGVSFSVFRKARRKQFQSVGWGQVSQVFLGNRIAPSFSFCSDATIHNPTPNRGGGGQFPVSDHFWKQYILKFNLKKWEAMTPLPQLRACYDPEDYLRNKYCIWGDCGLIYRRGIFK